MASGYNVHVSLTMDGKSIQGTLNLTEKEMDRFIARTQAASGATDKLGAATERTGRSLLRTHGYYLLGAGSLTGLATALKRYADAHTNINNRLRLTTSSELALIRVTRYWPALGCWPRWMPALTSILTDSKGGSDGRCSR